MLIFSSFDTPRHVMLLADADFRHAMLPLLIIDAATMMLAADV